jgi:pimeloyl-ACP methyl ester carboxylesterase
MPVEPTEVLVRGKPARVFVGGAGDALLLVHGGWAGARMHWSRVWDALAEHHRVIAPDLPGLGAVEQAPLPTVRDYAAWLVDLLDALGVARAWCVGNSFGGTVVLSLAGRFPARCAGIVLVDAVPMPRTPPPLRFLGKAGPARALMSWIVARWSYTRDAIPRAFADPAHVPPELEHAITDEWPIIVPRFVDLLIAGDGPPEPIARTVLLWGGADRLPGTTRKDAQRIHARLRGSTLRFIEHAGHFPQVEAPDEFVTALQASVA